MSTPQLAPSVYTPEWSFADKFRKARLLAGMEQRAFADALGLTSSTVAAYETGRSTPRFKDASGLAKKIQVLTRIDYRWFLDVGPTAPTPQTEDYKVAGLPAGELIRVDFGGVAIEARTEADSILA